jgi:hypothetical protein
MDDDFGGNNAVKYLVGCTWTAIPPGPLRLRLPRRRIRRHCTFWREIPKGTDTCSGSTSNALRPWRTSRVVTGDAYATSAGLDVDDEGGWRMVTDGEDARLCEWDLSRDDRNNDVVRGVGGTSVRARSARSAVGG